MSYYLVREQELRDEIKLGLIELTKEIGLLYQGELLKEYCPVLLDDNKLQQYAQDGGVINKVSPPGSLALMCGIAKARMLAYYGSNEKTSWWNYGDSVFACKNWHSLRVDFDEKLADFSGFVLAPSKKVALQRIIRHYSWQPLLTTSDEQMLSNCLVLAAQPSSALELAQLYNLVADKFLKGVLMLSWIRTKEGNSLLRENNVKLDITNLKAKNLKDLVKEYTQIGAVMEKSVLLEVNKLDLSHDIIK